MLLEVGVAIPLVSTCVFAVWARGTQCARHLAARRCEVAIVYGRLLIAEQG